jgi:methylase of polypeptide subunit release factors
MTDRPDDHPLTLPDPDTARQMREVLQAHGFLSPRPLERLRMQEKELSSLNPQGRALSFGLWKTRQLTPEDILLRLFLLGRPVHRDAACRALAPTFLDDWTRAGVLETRDEAVRARVVLAPVQGLVLASDALWGEGPPEKHVMGFAASTQTLDRLVIRRPSRATLDLGTGNGIHALRAARHSDRVVAADLNPRAANFTAFNARLNGITNVEARTGDLYAPVAGEKFDLIVANPPFVISPERRYLFRDGSLPGDELSRRVIREGADHLHEDGFLQVLFEWACRSSEDWKDRLRGWVRDTGCDGWLIRVLTSTPEEHAEVWVGSERGGDPDQYAEMMQHWLDYYEQEQIEAIGYGFLTLRRRSCGGDNWFACDDPPLIHGPAGDSVLRGFAQRDFLQKADRDVLLATRFRLAPELRLEQQMAPTATGWEVRQSQLRIISGLGFAGEANPYVFGLLDRCRGEKTLREVVHDLESSIGEELDKESCLGAVRSMVEQGFLIPATDPQ